MRHPLTIKVVNVMWEKGRGRSSRTCLVGGDCGLKLYSRGNLFESRERLWNYCRVSCPAGHVGSGGLNGRNKLWQVDFCGARCPVVAIKTSSH